MGFKGWRKFSKDKDAWKLILKESSVPYGLYCQWGEWKTFRRWYQCRAKKKKYKNFTLLTEDQLDDTAARNETSLRTLAVQTGVSKIVG